MSAFKRQVGGSHYADFAIQPVYFCQKNGLGACESSIIKYACRWKKKHKNSVDDLRKIIHYAELLIPDEHGRRGDKRRRYVSARASI
jgi:hypothetical protein